MILDEKEALSCSETLTIFVCQGANEEISNL